MIVQPPVVYPCPDVREAEKLWLSECIQWTGVNNMATLAISPATTLRDVTRVALREARRVGNCAPRSADPGQRIEGIAAEIEPGLALALKEASDLISMLNTGVSLSTEAAVCLADGIERACRYMKVLLRTCADLGLFMTATCAATLNRLEYSADHLEHFAESFRESANGRLNCEISEAINQLQEQLSTVS
jgi:hypothetical protein